MFLSWLICGFVFELRVDFWFQNCTLTGEDSDYCMIYECPRKGTISNAPACFFRPTNEIAQDYRSRLGRRI
jgi:hypothetical protein